MKNVTESIWDNGSVIIPLAEVSHIEKHKDTPTSKGRMSVIFKHSKCNNENGDLEPNAYLDSTSNSEDFINSWCRYRSELEHETLADLTPDQP